jgi:polyhydroxyalkanoate synthesis repressor PhaR
MSDEAGKGAGAAAAAANASKDPKVIKRYTNRKLYDTVESRYVTLDEIAEMIKQGVEVKVVDNRSKEDLTSVTLAQIIFEEEKKKNQMPLSVLREIIRHPGETLTGFFQKEVSPRVASLREEAESRIDKLLHRKDDDPAAPASAAEPADASGSSAAEMLKASQRTLEDFQRKVDERVKVVVENVVGSFPAAGRDLQALLQRLESLESKLDALEKKK